MSAMTVPFVFADVEHSSNVLDGQPSADSAFKRSLDGIAVPRHEPFVHKTQQWKKTHNSGTILEV